MAAALGTSPDSRRNNVVSPRPKGRENSKNTLCRNIGIYGHCRYENEGCAFNHDQNSLKSTSGPMENRSVGATLLRWTNWWLIKVFLRQATERRLAFVQTTVHRGCEWRARHYDLTQSCQRRALHPETQYSKSVSPISCCDPATFKWFEESFGSPGLDHVFE